MYDFDRYDFGDYVSDYERATTLASMNENRYLLDDKVVTYLYLTRVGVPTPTVHGFVHDGRIVWLGSEPPAGGLDGLLERRGELVVKSRSGSGGSGFALLRREAGITTVNGRTVDDAASTLGGGSLVITDFVRQHDRIAAIYPNSTNTMRVMTFRDIDTDEPFVAFATHRFGTKRSEPVDNFGAGGLSVGIDLETGVLQQALCRLPGAAPGSREIAWIEEHPDTGARITGTKIPGWEDVLDVVLRAAATLPGSRYVGWDLAITDDGVSVIEGNNRGDVLVQMHGPLLVDDRLRKIFAARRR
ncbi:MAG: hypothetical protein JWR45_56 [Blastococcus sp.]|nr:hypothetical protein [Blastococcus sp.]